MNVDDHAAVLVAAKDDPTLAWEPAKDLPLAALAAYRTRQHRMAIRGAAVAVVALVTAGTVIGAAAVRSGSGSQRDQLLTRPTPSASPTGEPAVDLTVGYIPAGYSYVNTEHGPRNVAVDVTRRYELHGDPHNGVLLVVAQYGLVNTLEQARQNNGPVQNTTVNGRPALIGWTTGKTGTGLHALYMLLDRYTAIDVVERPGSTWLPDSELERVAASVTVTTSGTATSTIVVPNVVGLSQTEAGNTLDAAGAGLPVVENVYGTTVHRDHVVSQSPAAGAHVPRGTSVTLKIAG